MEQTTQKQRKKSWGHSKDDIIFYQFILQIHAATSVRSSTADMFSALFNRMTETYHKKHTKQQSSFITQKSQLLNWETVTHSKEITKKAVSLINQLKDC